MNNRPKTQSEINDLEIELQRVMDQIEQLEKSKNELVQRAKEILRLLKG